MSSNVVPLKRGAEQGKPSLAPILSLTASAMNSVNSVILDRMQSEIPLIPALANPRDLFALVKPVQAAAPTAPAANLLAVAASHPQ